MAYNGPKWDIKYSKKLKETVFISLHTLFMLLILFFQLSIAVFIAQKIAHILMDMVLMSDRNQLTNWGSEIESETECDSENETESESESDIISDIDVNTLLLQRM